MINKQTLEVLSPVKKQDIDDNSNAIANESITNENNHSITPDTNANYMLRHLPTISSIQDISDIKCETTSTERMTSIQV